MQHTNVTHTSVTKNNKIKKMSLSKVTLSYIRSVLPCFYPHLSPEKAFSVTLSDTSVTDEYSLSSLLKSLLFAICHQKQARIRVLVTDNLVTDNLVTDALRWLLKAGEAWFTILPSVTKFIHLRSTSVTKSAPAHHCAVTLPALAEGTVL